jgi:hypothetical protein
MMIMGFHDAVTSKSRLICQKHDGHTKKDYRHTTKAATDKTPLFLSNLVSKSLTLDIGAKDTRVAHRGPAKESNWQHVQLLQTPVH